MIPVLYNADETRFINNGHGRLTDCISCVVTEERNGIYEMEFEYPITGVHFDEIILGRIVTATHDDKNDVQPFEIYARSVPDLRGVVTFNAHHISYKLSNVTVMPFTAGSCAAALQGISTNSANPNPFTFWTDKTVVGTFENTVPRLARNMLGGEQNSILDVYGKGDYEFDKWTVKLHLNRGVDTDVEIRYSKNLTDLNQDIDGSGTYNAVVPYWADSEGNIVTLPEEVIVHTGVSPQIAYLTDHNLVIIRTEDDEPIEVAYSKAVAVPMDMTSYFSERPTEAQLRAAAQTRLANSDAWVPSENLTVDFVQLWQTEEFADYSALQRVGLCDTVSVYYPQVGIEAVKQKVVKTVYNVLLDRYDSIELGSLQTSLGQAIKADVLADVPTTSMMQAAIEYATDLIRGGLGGYVVMTPGADGYPQEILIMDTPDVDTAVNVWRFNQGGLGHSSNGYNGPFSDIALTQDGKINASMITTGILNANIITAGTISDGSGTNSWNLDSGVLTTQKGNIGPFEITSSQIRYEQTNGDYFRLQNDGLSFKYGSSSGSYLYYLQTGQDGLRLRFTPTGGSAADCPQITPYYYHSMADDTYYAEATINAKNAIRLGKYADNIRGQNPLTVFVDEPGNIGQSTTSVDAKVLIQGKTYIVGNFTVSGTKSREAETDNYSKRLLYAYETPTPLFGDIGETIIDDDGLAYVDIDDIFSETIANNVEYQVFLQKEGEGDCWVSSKERSYFVIQGTPNLKVAWELKAKQKDYQNIRLEHSESVLAEYEYRTDVDLNDYITEQEELLYGNY